MSRKRLLITALIAVVLAVIIFGGPIGAAIENALRALHGHP